MLRWNTDWAETREHWERMLEMGRKVPEPFLDQPELLAISYFYWSAFCDLSSERQIGMSVGPIPRSAVLSYARDHGLDDESADRFWHIMNDVDAENMRLMHAATKAKMGKGEGVSASPSEPGKMKTVMENLRAKKAPLSG